MPVQTYTKPTTRVKKARHATKRHASGRSQHKSTAKGAQHTDFRRTYRYEKPNVDLFKQTFRFVARTGGDVVDISRFVESASWQEQSTSGSDGQGVLAYMNYSAPMTGSIQMRKPALSEYKKLVPPLLNSVLDRSAHGSARFGAIGVVIVCEVGYQGHFTPLWAMRVQPSDSSTGSGAEQIDLTDGTWTLQLADDLQSLNQSVDDFKFTKGKRSKTKGWRAHEVTAFVCKQYGVAVKQLARGTVYSDMPIKDTTGVTPLSLIVNAYQREMDQTGKAFVVRWSAPTKKHPLGALEVVPLRRNPMLLKFREQLTAAVLTRSQQPGYATVITGRATLKDKNGKHKQITVLVKRDSAVRRFGFVHKIIDFKPVSSTKELEILTKRALAFRLTPLRTAQLTHPGITTVRRGDAVRIHIPEEGYSQIMLPVFQTPRPTVASMKAAQAQDPSLFGLPDPSLLSPTDSGVTGDTTATSTSTTVSASNSQANAQQAITQETPIPVPVADQSIAFVSDIQHSVDATSYTMQLTCSFIDILDPVNMKAEIEANIRNAKAAAAAAAGQISGTPAAAPSSGGGPKWKVTASAEDDPVGASGSCHAIQSHGYSELSTVPQGTGSDFAALGHIPCGTELRFTNPSNGRTTTATKQDVGAGSSFLPVLGIYPGTRAELDLDRTQGYGRYTVIIERTDGQPLHPVRGTPA